MTKPDRPTPDEIAAAVGWAENVEDFAEQFPPETLAAARVLLHLNAELEERDTPRTQWCPDCKRLADENAAARRRIAMLELLVESHEGDGYEMFRLLDEMTYYTADNPNQHKAAKEAKAIVDGKGFPSYDHLGHPTDYTPADLAALPEWPAADKWLADRQEEADNGITPAATRERKEP